MHAENARQPRPPLRRLRVGRPPFTVAARVGRAGAPPPARGGEWAAGDHLRERRREAREVRGGGRAEDLDLAAPALRARMAILARAGPRAADRLQLRADGAVGAGGAAAAGGRAVVVVSAGVLFSLLGTLLQLVVVAEVGVAVFCGTLGGIFSGVFHDIQGDVDSTVLFLDRANRALVSGRQMLESDFRPVAPNIRTFLPALFRFKF